jgi:hypothetical protein
MDATVDALVGVADQGPAEIWVVGSSKASLDRVYVLTVGKLRDRGYSVLAPDERFVVMPDKYVMFVQDKGAGIPIRGGSTRIVRVANE